MNTLEKYCIYKRIVNNYHLNDQFTSINNPTFNIIHKHETNIPAEPTPPTFSTHTTDKHSPPTFLS